MIKFKLILLGFFPFLLTGQSQIVSAEYFFGQDPGFGNATDINIQAANNLSTVFTIPAGDLSPGFHVLHLRVKNSNGIWSLYAQNPFFVMNLPNPQRLIERAEYYIDVDPGIGNATPLQMLETYELNEVFAIPLDNLNTGIHTLYVRIKNNEGQWSHFTKKNFFVNTELPNLKVIELEYFIDEDMGEGNATAAAVTEGIVVDEIVNLLIPPGITTGEHVLYTRVKNELLNWSQARADTFFVDDESNIISLANNLKISPNPSTGLVNFHELNNAESELLVISANGQLVFKTCCIKNSVDLSHLPTGVYLLQLSNNKGYRNVKWVKG